MIAVVQYKILTVNTIMRMKKNKVQQRTMSWKEIFKLNDNLICAIFII